MTEALFHTASYLKEVTASVTGVDDKEHAVVLDKTVFFSGGGGQPCDTGRLILSGRETAVTKVMRRGDDILHRLEGELPAVGER